MKKTQDETQAAHTPGPWAFTAHTGPRDVTLKRHHFRVGQAGAPNRGVAIAFGDDEANARLIAAAPDLLTALKQVRFHCVVEGATGRASVALNANHAVFAQIDAAIAKAEGREGR